MDRLYVDTILKSQFPRFGQSKPLIVLAEDGEEYILKNEQVNINGNWIHENAVFFNETLVYKIAKYLEIKIPDCVALVIDDELVSANADMLFQRRMKSGLYFGSKKVNNVEDNLEENYALAMQQGKPYILRSWNNYYKKIENINDIAKIIALDFFIGNYDRFANLGNLIIGTEDGYRNAYAIDHGHAFRSPIIDSQKWDYLNINKIKPSDVNQYHNFVIRDYLDTYSKSGALFEPMGPIFKAIETHIFLEDVTNHSFIDPIFKLENLTTAEINEFISEIPEEWVLHGAKQTTEHAEYLNRQKLLVRGIIEKLTYSRAFTNYRGGLLSWKELENIAGMES